jgi:hypothetical protein
MQAVRLIDQRASVSAPGRSHWRVVAEHALREAARECGGSVSGSTKSASSPSWQELAAYPGMHVVIAEISEIAAAELEEKLE